MWGDDDKVVQPTTSAVVTTQAQVTVTCDGTFDRKTRSYTSNLVVWANLAPPAAGAAFR